jgi:DNA-binding MarR family transcriptional regulator
VILTDHRFVLGALEPQTALPAIPKLEPIPAVPQDLELLLNEVNALTFGLKQASRLEDPGGLLSATQCVLRFLREGPKTVPQIARVRGTSRQNVQILVNRLRREALVALVANPAHKRSALVELTEQGKRALALVTAVQGDFTHSMSPPCSQSEVRSAVALLRRLREAIVELQSAPSVTGAVGPQRKRASAAQTARAEKSASLAMPLEESSTSAYELPVSLL